MNLKPLTEEAILELKLKNIYNNLDLGDIYNLAKGVIYNNVLFEEEGE